MSDSIGSVTQAPHSTPQTTQVSQASPDSKQAPAPAAADKSFKEVVQLSSAAQAALRESMETPAQTAKEAGAGDIQAKHLIAKQAAGKAALAKLHTA